MDAYIMIHTEPGTAALVRSLIADLDGVARVDRVIGQYDLVVRICGDDSEDLPVTTLREVQQVPGVARTLTCPVLHIRRASPVPAAV